MGQALPQRCLLLIPASGDQRGFTHLFHVLHNAHRVREHPLAVLHPDPRELEGSQTSPAGTTPGANPAAP